MTRLCLVLVLLIVPHVAHTEEVVAGLSQDAISITANFAGSEILIFGAVRRAAPPDTSSPIEVINTIEGPSRPVTVRRKNRRLGIWVNTEASNIDAAPTFYAISTTSQLAEVLTQTEDLRHNITIPQAIRAVGTGVADQETFTDALIRIRQSQDLYQLNENAVRFRAQTLFDTTVQLPANLVEGAYTARIFLTRGGDVVDIHHQIIQVRKVGLERFIYTLAHEWPLVYGVLSLFLAIFAGWLAAAVFRYIRT